MPQLMIRSTKAHSIIQGCQSWPDFEQALAVLSAKEKGEVFERLSQLYLQTKPEYKTSLKFVWRLSELPPRVRRNLSKLPGPDEGIDLVAETRSGKFWAVQCKYKSNRNTALTVKELSTFTNLAHNSCAGHFAHAVVMHTTNKPVRKHKLLGNTTEIGLQRWLELTQEEWGLIHAKINNKLARPQRRYPRPHQQKAINAAKNHFVKKNQTRGKLLMPCGTGKSLCALWISQALKSKITLVVVPSLSLVKQSVEDWTRELLAQNANPLPEWLCVCSDKTVGGVARDEFVEDVYDLGLPVTTNPQEIKTFLKKSSAAPKIIFLTYQSSPIFAKAARLSKVKIDLAILDEAHKTAGEKSKAFSTVLFDKNVPLKRRMFMTATERVMRGSHDEVVSMNNLDIYGDCFYHLSFKSAIHSEPAIISDYKVLTLFLTQSEIEEAIRERAYITDPKGGIHAEEARSLAAAIALRKTYKKHNIKHAVSFHRSIKAASDFAELQNRFNGVKTIGPKVDCFHISSKKSAGQRTELLRDFAQSNRALITNARCLTEGVDVPAIDCVLFADPKQSTVDIVQAAGRALRPFSGKKYGYIMLPIVVPDGLTFEEFAESTDFRTVSKVIAALSTQDERIAEEFRVSQKAKSTKASIIEFGGDVPVGMKLELRDFVAAVSVKIWERVGRVNWRIFDEAREYAHSLSLTGQAEWNEFAQSGKLPSDIPAAPNSVYKDIGWIGWGDWLGTGNVAPSDRAFRPFNEARAHVHSLNLKSKTEWREFLTSDKLPRDIPRNPSVSYKNEGWIGWGDWLGTGQIAPQNKVYRPFKGALAFARSLNLTSKDEWSEFAKSGKLPSDIPAGPARIYWDEGWIGWGDWLGTGGVANQNKVYRPFTQARKFVRSLNLTSREEWKTFTKSGKLPSDIPAAPENSYKNEGWIGWGDWLGTGSVAPQERVFRPFKQARAFVRSLNLKSLKEWSELVKSGKLPSDIRANPYAYKNEGWKGMGDWLGTGIIAPFLRQYRPFRQARSYAHSLNLKSVAEWSEFAKSGKLPSDIPANPRVVYQDKGWIGWGDWLDTGRVANQNKVYRPFEQARDYARSLNLKSGKEWRELVKSGNLPSDLPAAPWRTYKDKGWIGWGDWLGKSQ